MKILAGDMKFLTEYLDMEQVLDRCLEVLDPGSTSTMSLPATVMNRILVQMVNLAEQEPYGVKGGTLVVSDYEKGKLGCTKVALTV